MKTAFPASFLIDTSDGPAPLNSERAKAPLPSGPEGKNPTLYYGPYFEALFRFLSRDSFEPLLSSLTEHLGRTATADSIRRLDVISEKHGALYHVAHLKVHLHEGISSLALYTAATREQKASMEAEPALLRTLRDSFALPFLPRPYQRGDVLYEDRDHAFQQPLSLFLAEWFDEHHEFHLSDLPGQSSPGLKVWAPDHEEQVLPPDETRALYTEAAFILTSYLDPKDFRQIYPWHHAAGDFILRRREGSLDVRLVTARGYRTLASVEAGFDENWVGPVHFFLNMSIRMRLDRYDGTGGLAWADAGCIEAVVSGFLKAWKTKAERCPALPSSVELLGVLRQFAEDEWLALSEIVLADCMVEKDEIPFLLSRMKEHASSLSTVLAEY